MQKPLNERFFGEAIRDHEIEKTPEEKEEYSRRVSAVYDIWAKIDEARGDEG